MNSRHHSSSSSSSSSHPTFLCPRVRCLQQMDPETNSIENRNDRSLEKSHHLSRLRFGFKGFLCGACKHTAPVPFHDFWCYDCYNPYHKECVKSPPEIKVLYHPKHPLQLIFTSPNTSHAGSSLFNKCNCCGEDTEGFYYFCSMCDFSLHPLCALRLNILSINYPKRHDHTFTYFPRINSLTCDVCALGDHHKCIYVCYQCDFVVHKTCIYLPTTIRISRHDHRLSFTPCLPILNKDLYCGVCRKRVDKNYGEYSCVKDCEYVVHPKCATRKDLWDGKELEGKPETEYEDIKAFKEISDGVIEHFNHPNHYMRLDKKEDDKVDDGKRCQACILPIYEGNIYNCMRCDFILHETCANLPRKKWHQLHAHPLTLQVNPKRGKFKCEACRNHCCGFAYTCCEDRCSFTLDVRCALVSEPFVHELHPHPLFLTSEEGKFRTCSMCGKQKKHLNCIECSFVFCFCCATLPYKVKYKHDEHYLTLSYKEDAGEDNWCEICEKKTDPHVGFYTCKVLCSITLHIECLLGVDPFMNHGQIIKIGYIKYSRIIPNDGLTRKRCDECGKYCPYRIAYKYRSLLYCSLECVTSF